MVSCHLLMFALSPLVLFYSSLISSGLGAAVWVRDALSWQLSKVSCAHVQSVSASVPSQRKKCLSVHIYKNESKVCVTKEKYLCHWKQLLLKNPGTTQISP